MGLTVFARALESWHESLLEPQLGVPIICVKMLPKLASIPGGQTAYPASSTPASGAGRETGLAGDPESHEATAIVSAQASARLLALASATATERVIRPRR